MGWLVLLPPIVAIGLAMWTRQVFLSLFVGIWFGTTLLVGGNPLLGLRELVDQLAAVMADSGNAKIVFFCLLVGGLVALVQASGGVAGFVTWAQERGWATTRRGAEMMAVIVGLIVFVESSITSLTVGAVSRPFFDRLDLPREKLAYYCDATSAPVCMSIPLNGWGAYILGLLAAQGMATGAVALLAKSLLFNFFSLLAIALAIYLAWSGRGWGPMRHAEVRAETLGQITRPGSVPMISDEVADIPPVEGARPRVMNLLVPLVTMIVMIFVSLWITGDGQIMQGSGSTAVLWSVGTAIFVAAILYLLPINGSPTMSLNQSTDVVIKGMSGLVPATILIVFAFAIGQVSRALEMGPYLVSLVGEETPAFWLPALMFLVSSFVSFTLGSSWTTFAIMIPVALPLAAGLGIGAPLMLGALLSGGVFGDHASPLSDTSIISSMAAACDHVDHINTQLPYTLVLAAVTTVLYLAAGIVA